MFCPNCGADNPHEAKFCGGCGQAMVTVAAPPPPAPVVSPGMKTGVILGSIFIPVLGLILGIIYMADQNPEKKAVGKTWLIVSVVVCLVWCLLGFFLGVIGTAISGSQY